MYWKKNSFFSYLADNFFKRASCSDFLNDFLMASSCFEACFNSSDLCSDFLKASSCFVKFSLICCSWWFTLLLNSPIFLFKLFVCLKHETKSNQINIPYNRVNNTLGRHYREKRKREFGLREISREKWGARNARNLWV